MCSNGEKKTRLSDFLDCSEIEDDLSELVSMDHYIDVIMSTMAFQITSVSIACWAVYSGGDKKKPIKAPRHWPLWGEFTGHRWIPRTKGQ